MMQSCSNTSPHSGCSSSFLAMIGGRRAVLERGSTGWFRNSASSLNSAAGCILCARLESERTRLTMLALSVRCFVSDIDWAEILPRVLATVCGNGGETLACAYWKADRFNPHVLLEVDVASRH